MGTPVPLLQQQVTPVLLLRIQGDKKVVFPRPRGAPGFDLIAYANERSVKAPAPLAKSYPRSGPSRPACGQVGPENQMSPRRSSMSRWCLGLGWYLSTALQAASSWSQDPALNAAATALTSSAASSGTDTWTGTRPAARFRIRPAATRRRCASRRFSRIRTASWGETFPGFFMAFFRERVR